MLYVVGNKPSSRRECTITFIYFSDEDETSTLATRENKINTNPEQWCLTYTIIYSN